MKISSCWLNKPGLQSFDVSHLSHSAKEFSVEGDPESLFYERTSEKNIKTYNDK